MPPKNPSLTHTWGSRYDTLSTSPQTPPAAMQDACQPPSRDVNASTNGHVQHKDDKLPNASIFVGSLPSGVDPAELARLLTGHFSEYSGVRAVKVIRDSKGGVCAFVQCENAASASVFLQSLRSSPPKPFLGRILRYEPAKAFRTLLISYRAPSRAIMSNGTGVPSGTMDGLLNLELPYAMRLWKPKNTKFHRIIYNAEAIEAELYSRTRPKEDVDSELEKHVYLQPLRFDAESVLKLARYFGPLEKFFELTGAHELAEASLNGDHVPECHPPPHNLPRSKVMNTSCWEVKWVQRDDCVAALTALRKVPHLSVSWAHQPAQPAEHRHDLETPVSHVSTAQTRADSSQLYPSPDSTSPSEYSQSDAPSDKPIQQSAAENDDLIVHKRGSVFGIDERKGWVKPVVPPGLVCKGPPVTGAALATTDEREVEKLATTRINWVETSFPSFLDSGSGSNTDWSAWKRTSGVERDIRPPSIVAPQSACQVLTPKNSQVHVGLADRTPALGLAISPPTPGMTVLQTPTPISQTGGVILSGEERKYQSEETNNGSPPTRDLDPMSLFVGGLEVYGTDPWTEGKVYTTFGRFGGLEYVKFVRPPNGNTAFAFIKYNNTESPARAILEEHNRVYGGHALKVQLRDNNPPRGQWRHDRGRVRCPHHHANRKVMLSVRPGNNTPRTGATSTVRRSLDAKVDASKVPLLDTASTHEITEYKRDGSIPGDKQSLVTIARSTVNGQTEKYREWYDALAGSPVGSGGALSRSTTPTLSISAPHPAPGYYPVPWPYPYAQLGHYQMPYCGPYPGYAFPAGPIPPFASTTPGPDANGPVTGGHPPWPSMMYNAYPPYFCPPPLPVAEHPPPSAVPQISQTSQGPRAPLVPSGFIQNGQGTLIAVYPPDALSQYMAAQNNDGTRSSDFSTPMQPVNTAPVSPATQVHQELASNHSVGSHTGNNPPRLYPAPTNPPWDLMPPPVMPLNIVTNTAPPSGNVANALRSDEPHSKAGVNGHSSTNTRKNQVTRKDFRQQNIGHSRRDRMQNENLSGNMEGVRSHNRYSLAT